MTRNLRKANEKSIEAYREFNDPEKHAARKLIWLPEAKYLKEKKRRYLKYFTLPGKLAFDIFFFEMNDILEHNERGFPDVRFCDNNRVSYATAKKLLGNTVGIRKNFEELVLQDRNIFWDKFPYDIYNLDFCGTCFPDEQPPFSDTFKAISKIIERHTQSNLFPFTIFLTMKALDAEMRVEAKEDLIENIETNRRNSEFADRINSLIPNTKTFVKNSFVDFLIISIPKLLCHLACEQCDMDVISRAKYLRYKPTVGNYHITKYVFRFSKRRQKSLKVRNGKYIENILNVLDISNVKTIDKSCINKEIKDSLNNVIQRIDNLM
jgi:hypothetical protein